MKLKKMTDKWFLQDIDHHLNKRNRVVILDPQGKCGFLLALLEGKSCLVIKTDPTLTEQWQTVKEELFLRYEAETRGKEEAVVFYTTRPLDKLSFLFDYCFTHGCIDLSNPYEWIKKKIFSHTGLQVNMENPMLLNAAKLGIGKDLAWWKKVVQNLEELLSVEEELLPFLNEPERHLHSKDPDIRRLFEEKLFELTGRPYLKKPPKTLAEEVATFLFDCLLANEIEPDLLKMYYKWVDSETYYGSLKHYLPKYKIEEESNPWAAHPDHCFQALDQKAIRQICNDLKDKSLRTERLAKIKPRANSPKAKKVIPQWWKDVITLFDFETKDLVNCTNLDSFIEFYTTRFIQVDRAIRNLYEQFLQEESIIRPLQEYFESLNHELLQRWFELTKEYKSNQQGHLPKLLKSAVAKTAIIVADGLRFEIADTIANNLEKAYKVERNVMLADMPSETEHNMSALYADDGSLIPVHKDREKKLTAITGSDICYMNLEAVNYGLSEDFLVLTYKDIDYAGEKLQLSAIKLFKEFEKVIAEKIELLLKLGYREVHMVTDHGFVLTGLLDESDKIEPDVPGKKVVGERYIRTIDKPSGNEWIAFERPYGDYRYVVVSKNFRPFKSKGLYGFSHGGLTPQEVIIPNFVFRKEEEIIEGLAVSIANKKELSDVAGEVFGLKLKAGETSSDLFSSERKVQVLFYSKGAEFSKSNILSIKSGASESFEFSFEGNEEVLVVVVDADSKQQLDSVKVSKSKSRDLGGLLG